MARKVNSFIHFAQALARTTGRTDHGVHITFGGSTAYTDGNSINLPALPPGTMLTPYQERILTGYVDHESAHLRWTDFTAWNKEAKLPGADTLFPLVNQLEDIRIENKHIQYYPGVRGFLDDLASHVDDEGRQHLAQAKALGYTPNFLAVLYYHVYKNHRGIDTGILPDDLSAYPQWEQQRIMLDTCLPTCKNTREIIQLAKDLFNSLPQEDKEKLLKGKPCEGPGKPGQQGGGSVGFDGHKARDGAGQQVLATIAGTNKGLEKEGKNVPGPDGSPGDKPSNRNRWVQSDHSGQSWFPPATTAHDRVLIPSGCNMPAYEATRAATSAEISSLKKMLNLYLRSRRKRAWSRGLEVGRLDTTRLPALITTGTNRIMKDRRDSHLVNTALVLLVDLSASMNTDLTRTAAIMTSEAFDGVDHLSLEILGFTTNFNQTNEGQGRRAGLDMFIYKSFKQDYRSAKPHLGDLRCYGNTPLGDAYGYGLERIATRPEPKRALWIITDGQPYYRKGSTEHSDFVLMHQLHNKARALAIDTVGLYIGDKENPLKGYVNRMAQASDTQSLPTALMDMVKDTI